MAANSQFYLMDGRDVSDPSFLPALSGKTGGTGLYGEDKDGNRDRTGEEEWMAGWGLPKDRLNYSGEK